MPDRVPTKEDIVEAHSKISPYIHRVPILSSKAINKIMGAEIFFKCENLQKGGAFKARGATNSLLSLNDEDLKKGVATHSSGNHAAALARAASVKNIPAYIVMPRTAPEIKKKAVAEYGGEIVLCEPTLQSREETLEKIVEETGATFIHPYNNYSVVAGQATSAKEVFEEFFGLDYLITPVGGGGLLSGSSLSAKYFSPSTKVIGAEPLGADDAVRSFRDHKIYPSVSPKTIADGLLTSLGEKTFDIILNNTYEIKTAEESSIIEAMRLVWERMKIIIEPSSAVPLAMVSENKDYFRNKRIAIIISGGNVDFDHLPW